MSILRGVLLLVSVSMIAVVFATSDNRLDARLGFGVAIGAAEDYLAGHWRDIPGAALPEVVHRI